MKNNYDENPKHRFPLVCIPSPRDIPEVIESVHNLRLNTVFAKYMPQPQAYSELRNYFLENEEYDTMVLFSDDLIVDSVGVNRLVEYNLRHPESPISGICNFDMYKNSGKYCFRAIGDVGYYPRKFFIQDYIDKWKPEEKEAGIYCVEFNGFACIVISRRIVELVPFRFDNNGGGVDQNFADDCRSLGIDVLVDINVEFKHLAYRLKRNELECSGLGIKEPEMIFRNSQGLEKWVKERNKGNGSQLEVGISLEQRVVS